MSTINNALQGKKVFITGTAGFVGSRLAQRLAVEEGAVVTGVDPRSDKPAFLKEVGVNLRQVNLDDAAMYLHLMKDQDILFHLARWHNEDGGTPDDAFAINVTHTQDVIQWAAESGIQRVVHGSLAAVYGIPLQDEVVTEETPLDRNADWIFARSMAEGDHMAQVSAAVHKIGLTTLRPSMVYGPGPHGRAPRIIRWIEAGKHVIIGDGDGHVFPTYVDNLVDALLLAAVSDKAVGEAFNICDGVITWKEWFGYYGRMASVEPQHISSTQAKFKAATNKLFREGKFLTYDVLDFYRNKANYPTDKAQNILGWQPRVSLEEGMKATEVWLREEGYI